MHADTEAGRGPSLGEPAPFIEFICSRKAKKRGHSGGVWTVLISHPQDLLPLFKTRTINYVLCKRRIRIVMIGNGKPEEGVSDGNFFTKYIARHNVAFMDDGSNIVSTGYGLTEVALHEEVKGVFVIDPKGILRMKLYFDLDHTRNFYEILKLVDTLQEADRQKKIRPATGVWKRRLSIISRPNTVTEKG